MRSSVMWVVWLVHYRPSGHVVFVYNCYFDCQGQRKLFLLVTSFTVMAPHPVRDVDMERKEELILAKQLRAARVTILSRVCGVRSPVIVIFTSLLCSRHSYSQSQSGRKRLLLLLQLRSQTQNPLPEPRTPWPWGTGTSASARLSRRRSTSLNTLNLW